MHAPSGVKNAIKTIRLFCQAAQNARAKVLYGYWCVVALLALAPAVDMIFVHPLTPVSVALTRPVHFAHSSGAGAMTLALAHDGRHLYVVCAMHRKMFVEIHSGWLGAKRHCQAL
ncbi:MAG: hypothetical protein IPI39_25050 [Candidatus Obscuribacter sp.]|nr:hypothetical protein [Candidatus Obscuribacter sp.]